jgi:tetratricopeptide (TPR) repeat protein
VRTRERLPQDWATTQNNLGVALQNQGIRTGGEAGAPLLAEAVTAYHQALEVRTRDTLPPQWAQTQSNLAQAYMHLEDWINAAASYAAVLTVYPDDKKAHGTASYLYHERLFAFPRAFVLNQQWLERNPADVVVQSDFAEKHFTTGRFSECEQRIALLLANPAVGQSTQVALQAIQIANSLALGKTDLVQGRIETMVEVITSQSEGFKVEWSFKGSRYFINNSDTLVPYRPWLMQLFNAVEGEDRNAILSALQEARASFPVELKQ